MVKSNDQLLLNIINRCLDTEDRSTSFVYTLCEKLLTLTPRRYCVGQIVRNSIVELTQIRRIKDTTGTRVFVTTST